MSNHDLDERLSLRKSVKAQMKELDAANTEYILARKELRSEYKAVMDEVQDIMSTAGLATYTFDGTVLTCVEKIKTVCTEARLREHLKEGFAEYQEGNCEIQNAVKVKEPRKKRRAGEIS